MTAGNTAFVGSVPENYDRYLGPVLFEPYAEDLVERLRLSENAAVLELACGTGIVTRRLRAPAVSPGLLLFLHPFIQRNPGSVTIAIPSTHFELVNWMDLPKRNALWIALACALPVGTGKVARVEV